MSAQVALMAGMAAMSAASTMASASAKAKALGQQGMASDLQAEQYQAQAEEVGAQTAENERQRRMAVLHLMSLNAAEITGRGVSGGQGTSADVLEGYNLSEAERDIRNVRFTGESQQRRLSFAAGSSMMNAQMAYGQVGPTMTAGLLEAGATLAGASYRYLYGSKGVA